MASGSEGDVESELEREELSARTKQRRRHLGRSRHSSDDETGKGFVTLCIMIEPLFSFCTYLLSIWHPI